MQFAVIGGGSIGKRHVGNLLTRGIDPSGITVVDPRADRREECVTRFGVNVAETAEALEALSLTGAFICSPTAMHVQHAVPLAKRGIHLLIEKPLDASLAGAAALAEAAEEGGAKILVGYCFRFSLHVRKLKELVDSGVIGRPLYVRGEFSEYLPDWHPYEDYRSFYMAKRDQGGGSLLDQSHIMDMVAWLFGQPDRIFAFNGAVSDLETDVDDMAEATLFYDSGLIASVHQDMFGRAHRKTLEVKGTLGNLEWNAYDLSVSHYDAASKTTKTYHTPKDYQIMYLNELDHFLALCSDPSAAPAVTLQEGIEGMQVIDAILKSNKTGALVAVAETP